ncbi:hypothetical protein H0A36_11555 [Endozoicomonas sp. SM1973]|uniref:Tetratricopeptide repeat protein n=1 Tax=Spartinivicinus marinus TaxID=2994442 RepID=A0A853IBP6_9GAMM|nr:hypothetical protein [Spartinivicinus marinus]MCX4027657.1 hypothetical protein [Spartinivicinus marinus]NYZ66645.1 hypothetical protein [Spartinivicinus marinus]
MSKKDYCKYHQREPATWRCRKCQKLYGDCCIIKPPQGLTAPKCLMCTEPLSYLGSANKIPPFWTQINRFFLYPFNQDSVMFLVISSLAFAALELTGLLGIFSWLILISIIYKYSYSIIELTSHGDMTPPSITTLFSGTGFSLFFRQLIVFILTGVFLYYLAKISIILFFVGLILAIFAFPASVMTLAWEHSVTAAINPSRLWFIISGIGWPYCILCVFLVILSISNTVVDAFLATKIHPLLFQSVNTFVNGYFILVMFSLMGYTLFQSQEKLGYTADMEDDELISDEEYYIKQTLADAEIYLKEGNMDQALSIVRSKIDQFPNDLDIHKRFHELLTETNDEKRLVYHGIAYLKLLLQTNNSYQASQVYLNCQKGAPSFPIKEAIEDIKMRHQIAEALINSGKPKEGLVLMKNLHQLDPQYPGLAKAYLLAGKTYSDRLHMDKQALQLLNFVAKKFPNSIEAKQATEFIKVINSLQAS